MLENASFIPFLWTLLKKWVGGDVVKTCLVISG